MKDTAKYFRGQKFLHIGRMAGKPEVAYLISGEDDFLIRMAEDKNGTNAFVMHRSKMKTEWRALEVGIQGELFSIPERKTVVGIWRKQYIKTQIK